MHGWVMPVAVTWIPNYSPRQGPELHLHLAQASEEMPAKDAQIAEAGSDMRNREKYRENPSFDSLRYSMVQQSQDSWNLLEKSYASLSGRSRLR